MKISEAFDLYKNNYLLPRHYSRRVVESHGFAKVDFINKIGDKKLKNLTLEDVGEWSKSLEYRELPNGQKKHRAINTIRSYMNRLRAVIKYMCLRGEKCIDYQLIPIPKAEDVEIGFLYESEVKAMIDNAFSVRNKLVISLLYSSGIRLSELIALDRDSIKNKSFTVIGKGKKRRLCFIDSRTERLMKEYLKTRKDDSPALIISNIYKDRMSPTNIQLLIRNSAKRAGIERRVTPHMLRHSFATNFVRNNGNIRYLSRMLGHSGINTTMIYTHIVDNDLYKQYKRFHTV